MRFPYNNVSIFPSSHSFGPHCFLLALCAGEVVISSYPWRTTVYFISIKHRCYGNSYTVLHGYTDSQTNPFTAMRNTVWSWIWSLQYVLLLIFASQIKKNTTSTCFVTSLYGHIKGKHCYFCNMNVYMKILCWNTKYECMNKLSYKKVTHTHWSFFLGILTL